MKLWSSYLKEMKIAARGFYFYIEILVAVVMLFVLLVLVDENPVAKGREFLFYDMSSEVLEHITQKDIDDGKSRIVDTTEFKLRPIEFELTNRETGETKKYSFDDEKILNVETVELLDPETGKFEKTAYRLKNEDDLLRLSLQEKELGAVIKMNDDGKISYRYFLQGYETERLVNLLYIIHNETPEALQVQMNKQKIKELSPEKILNNRENILPLFITFAGSLMGFFIVMAYIFLDKSEGVIKAYAVTPSSVWIYLLSKIGVILTTVIVSSSIITIPVMGFAPNYLLLYIFLVVTTFSFAALGLLVASFYDSIEKAFGVVYLIMVVLMIPAFSYLIPGFDPVFLRFFPTYPILQGFKDILLNTGDISYVLTYSLLFLIGGLLLLLAANSRFKKTLTV